MNTYELNRYIENEEIRKQRIEEFLKENIIKKENIDLNEINGHVLKSERNLEFIKDNIKLDYLDWSITGCYYASYHIALALILTKGYKSKNHLATLLILIEEFYEDLKEDLNVFVELLDYQDVLFYVESKNKREDSTYSTNSKYTRKEVEELRIKTILFVSKLKKISLEKIQ